MRRTDDILSRTRGPDTPAVEAVPGLWVEHRGSGFVGVIETVERRGVRLRDDSGLLREFPLDQRGFLQIETGVVVTLLPPAVAAPAAPTTTASGAVAAPRAPAQVARADRLLVEGIHDAELIEKIWGDELRGEGVVVEPLHGVDNLAADVQQRGPGPDSRIAVLLDHLVAGSKESRIAWTVRTPWVAVDGHEFVDVWQAVRPHVLGLRAWPVVPPGRPWKDGVCEALGTVEPALLWRRILGAVTSYRDLEPSMVGAVERLLDFLLSPMPE